VLGAEMEGVSQTPGHVVPGLFSEYLPYRLTDDRFYEPESNDRRPMSIEHARKFVEHLHQDEALRKKVSFSTEHVVSAAKEKGLEVTPEDMKTALNEHWAANPNSKVLSEAPGF